MFRTFIFYIAAFIGLIVGTVERLLKKLFWLCVGLAINYFILVTALKFLASRF